MLYNQTKVEITTNNLIDKVKENLKDNYRLVQISCTKNEGFELTYSFDKEYNLLNLRLQISDDTAIPSITELYPYAFLYENEIKDLFGVKIENINLDFGGNLYKLSVKTPFNNPECK